MNETSLISTVRRLFETKGKISRIVYLRRGTMPQIDHSEWFDSERIIALRVVAVKEQWRVNE